MVLEPHFEMEKKYQRMSPRRGRAMQCLRETGSSMSSIASAFGVNQSTVSRYLSRGSQASAPTRTLKKSQMPKLGPRGARALVRAAKKERTATLKALSNSADVSASTARSVLRKNGICKRRAAIKPFLDDDKKRKRLDWCRKHQNWTLKDWMNVVWSDEASVQVGTDSQLTWVFRNTEERYHPDCLKPSFKSNRQSIMVWACFHGSNASKLQCFEKGSIDAKIYQKVLSEHLFDMIEDEDGILETQLQPSRLIFQQDNAPIHKAASTMRLFEAYNIRVMAWPPNSPDLNPIENCWTLMKRNFHRRWSALRASGKRNIPRSELCLLLKESWESIDALYLLSLVESMPRRVEAVLKAKGGHVKY